MYKLVLSGDFYIIYKNDIKLFKVTAKNKIEDIKKMLHCENIILIKEDK